MPFADLAISVFPRLIPHRGDASLIRILLHWWIAIGHFCHALHHVSGCGSCGHEVGTTTC